MKRKILWTIAGMILATKQNMDHTSNPNPLIDARPRW